MPQPGWYDDPDGTPRRLRWWDGTRWTEHIHGGAAIDAGGSTAVSRARRGPWPWIGLGVVGLLVGTIGFGLMSGLLSLGGPDRATPAPAATASRPAAADAPRATPTASTPEPTIAQLPPVTSAPRATAGPVVPPTPFPSLPASPPAEVDPGCPPVEDDPDALSDGRVTVTLPHGWTEVDTLAWLDCSRAAASTTSLASITLGLSPLQTADLQEAAEYVWSVALLDAAVPHPLTQASTAVRVADMEGWMVTGTMAIEDRLDELTVIALGSGEEPTILVTSASAQDDTSRLMIAEILDTVRRA